MYFVSVLRVTDVFAGRSDFGIIYVVTWSLVSISVALSMYNIFGITFSSIDIKWLLTSMTAIVAVVHDDSLLDLVYVSLSFSIKASGGRFTETCCLTVKVGKVRAF